MANESIIRNVPLRKLTMAAVAMGLAAVLQYVKVWQMPQGGSVSLEMIPLLFIALLEGPVTGIGAGVAFGLLKLLLEPYVVHPLQLILDYPLAFAFLGLAGFWPRRPWLGITLGVLGRLAAHVISGAIFFGSYAPKGMNVWIYSTGYNAAYIIPELILAVIILQILMRRRDLFVFRSGRQ